MITLWDLRVSGIDRQLEECKKYFERGMHIQNSQDDKNSLLRVMNSA